MTKGYQINELFQYADRTLMCVEHNSMSCDECYLNNQICNTSLCCGTFREDYVSVYFTNHLIFTAPHLTLQIKRKGCKVKVKVLELSEEFNNIEGDNFTIYRGKILTDFYIQALSVYKVGDKISGTFDTDQEAIEWVNGLFSLREEKI